MEVTKLIFDKHTVYKKVSSDKIDVKPKTSWKWTTLFQVAKSKTETSARESAKDRMTRSTAAECLQVVKHFMTWSRCYFSFFSKRLKVILAQ